MVLCVIDEGGYGADASAPVVAKTFNYLVLTHPVVPLKLGAQEHHSAPPRVDRDDDHAEHHDHDQSPDKSGRATRCTSLVALGVLAHRVPDAKERRCNAVLSLRYAQY